MMTALAMQPAQIGSGLQISPCGPVPRPHESNPKSNLKGGGGELPPPPLRTIPKSKSKLRTSYENPNSPTQLERTGSKLITVCHVLTSAARSAADGGSNDRGQPGGPDRPGLCHK